LATQLRSWRVSALGWESPLMLAICAAPEQISTVGATFTSRLGCGKKSLIVRRLPDGGTNAENPAPDRGCRSVVGVLSWGCAERRGQLSGEGGQGHRDRPGRRRRRCGHPHLCGPAAAKASAAVRGREPRRGGRQCRRGGGLCGGARRLQPD